MITQPDMDGWNTGRISFSDTDGEHNSVVIATQVNALGVVSWWRNALPRETLTEVCRDFWKLFPFREMGTNVASCVATEYNADDVMLQQQQFSFDTSDISLFGED